MLGQAREALIFAQCPTAVPKSDRLSSQHWVHFVPPSGACRSPVRAWGNSGSFSFLASNPCSGTPSRGWTQILELSSHTAIQLVAVLDPLEQAIVDARVGPCTKCARPYCGLRDAEPLVDAPLLKCSDFTRMQSRRRNLRGISKRSGIGAQDHHSCTAVEGPTRSLSWDLREVAKVPTHYRLSAPDALWKTRPLPGRHGTTTRAIMGACLLAEQE